MPIRRFLDCKIPRLHVAAVWGFIQLQMRIEYVGDCQYDSHYNGYTEFLSDYPAYVNVNGIEELCEK